MLVDPEWRKAMEQDRDERIRQRAYEIWESEGRPDGQATKHWEQAASEVGASEGEGEQAGGRQGDQAGGAANASGGGSGLATGLQPGGRIPSASPAAGAGSIGTRGGSTAGKPTGSAIR
jgi:Protein of unknown function (DUF2934)